MFWKWLWKGFAVLLVFSIFVGGGIAIFRAGFAQGITAGVWAPEEGGDLLRSVLDSCSTASPNTFSPIWCYHKRQLSAGHPYE